MDGNSENGRVVVIYGAGGHGKVVADVIRRSRTYRILGFLDDVMELAGRKLAGYEILGSGRDFFANGNPRCHLILAIGSNEVRRRLAEEVGPLGTPFAIAVHPSAQIAADVTIGPGTVIMANAVVNTGATIGAHVIINTGATVDHDCVIGDFVHVAPGVHLAGGVSVGHGALLGVGVNAVQGMRIGCRAVVGAGATVVQNIPDDVTAMGTPAVPTGRREAVESGL